MGEHGIILALCQVLYVISWLVIFRSRFGLVEYTSRELWRYKRWTSPAEEFRSGLGNSVTQALRDHHEDAQR